MGALTCFRLQLTAKRQLMAIGFHDRELPHSNGTQAWVWKGDITL
jgi:hypothetical protein